MSSPLCSPSLGPSWTDTHLLEVLTSTGNTPLPPTPWHSLTSSSLKRCDILISQGTGCLSSQVDNSQNCMGCRSLLAQKGRHRPSLFYQGGNSLGRTNKGSARFSPSRAQSSSYVWIQGKRVISFGLNNIYFLIHKSNTWKTKKNYHLTTQGEPLLTFCVILCS